MNHKITVDFSDLTEEEIDLVLEYLNVAYEDANHDLKQLLIIINSDRNNETHNPQQLPPSHP
jgi:hypothetical protein